MVVVSHFFHFFDKKLGEGVNRYESHPPSLRTIYFPTAPSIILFKLLFNLHAFHLRITTVNHFSHLPHGRHVPCNNRFS